MTTPVLLSAALLLLLPATRTEPHNSGSSPVPFQVVVMNSVLNTPHVTFSTSTVTGGILLGGLKRLMAFNTDFKFTYTEDPNYGPFLESVNGVAGNDKEQTYWELLVRTKDGKIIRPNVGIGCYIPNPKEQIILNFTKW